MDKFKQEMGVFQLNIMKEMGKEKDRLNEAIMEISKLQNELDNLSKVVNAASSIRGEMLKNITRIGDRVQQLELEDIDEVDTPKSFWDKILKR